MEKVYKEIEESEEYIDLKNKLKLGLITKKEWLEKTKILKLPYYEKYLRNLNRLGSNMGVELENLDTQLSLDFSIISNNTLRKSVLEEKKKKELLNKIEKEKKELLNKIEKDEKEKKELLNKIEKYKEIIYIQRVKNKQWCSIL